MPTVQATDIADLVASTLRHLGRMKVQQIAQSLQEYEVFTRWFKKDKLTFDEGYGIQRNLMYRAGDTARHRGLFDEDVVNIRDVIKQLTVDFRQADTSYAIAYQEVISNKGASRIFDLIKTRRAVAMLDLIEQLESKAWGDAPAVANVLDPFGIKYWVVTNSATGFTGGTPNDHSTVGGINLTTVPNFKNYAGRYVSVTKGDLIKKMRDMHRKTGFKSPVDVQDYTKGRGSDYRVYVNNTVISTLEEIGEAQNENLGRDIASVDGVDLAFRKNPIRWIPSLDASTNDPVYFINHSTFYPVAHKGDWFRETQRHAPNQHDVEEVFVDVRYNYVCVDRRRNGVLETSG